MNKMRKPIQKSLLWLSAVAICCCSMTFATAENLVTETQELVESEAMPDSVARVVPVRKTIFNDLSSPDAESGGYVIVNQTEGITQLLKPRRESAQANHRGYRIQIYSSNRGQEARERAFKIEKEILDNHPNMDVYVTYTAPFWKVRIGNCATYEDAQNVRRFMIDEFPAYATEINIVPSTIFIAD